ncbi:MAG TPA: TonB family protein [Flavobacteriales bacterium]|jgi:TonB family protein|nr:TonB family protein [Flavobacteriales bacterium]
MRTHTFLLITALAAGQATFAQTDAPLPAPGTPAAERMDQQAEYPGGPAAMAAFVRDHIQYPAEASANGIAGRVYVNLVISATGRVDSAWVAKRVHPLLDAEAVRVARLMHDWHPAKRNGHPLASRAVLPVSFVLPPDPAPAAQPSEQR